MRTLYFGDYNEFARNIINKLDVITCEDKFNDIAIIAKYEEAKQVIRELVCIGCDIHAIELHDELWDNYADEFIISVTKADDKSDSEYEVWCEAMRRKDGYISDEATIMYIMDNCSSKVIPYCNGEVVFEVSVGEESECADCDGKCCCDCNKEPDDKKINTTVKEKFTVNGKSVSRETYEKTLNEFEDRYLDNIKDMLLRYSAFMDDWCEWLKLL